MATIDRCPLIVLMLCITLISCAEEQPEKPKPKTYTEAEVRSCLTPKDFTWNGKILEEAGSSVFPEYEKILANPDSLARKEVLIYSVLITLDCDRSRFYPHCIEHLQYEDDDGYLRLLVKSLLVQIGTTDDIQILCALLSDESIGVSYATANEMPQIGDQNALDALNVWIVVRGPYCDQKTLDWFINSRDELKARLDKMEQPDDEE